ncbi:unnamed protein product [Dovyalis caffra]|uniref:F-box protein n=1 Tax=Dovyalis caffra TaxID=77055 RepID=A0AAV1RKY7_9ROSI|nr:unnamed protein product [Dovyalis caffra]
MFSPKITTDTLSRLPVKSLKRFSDYYATEVMGSYSGMLAPLNSDYSIAIYNPSTREKKMLPLSLLELPNDLDHSIVSCQFNFYGLGHDPIGEDYDIVYHPDCRRGYGVFANNSVVHWKATVVGQGKENGRDLIVAFDLGVEEFKIIPQPDHWSNEQEMNAGVLGGCLCVLCNQDTESLLTLNGGGFGGPIDRKRKGRPGRKEKLDSYLIIFFLGLVMDGLGRLLGKLWTWNAWLRISIAFLQY